MPKNKPAFVRLEADVVEKIHDELVSILWPGGDPIRKDDYRDRGLLESAVGRPFHSAFGEDAYPSLIEKAAALFQSLISNHPFADGNKRTAVVALQVFAIQNNYISTFINAELYDLAIRTASHKARGVTSKDSFKEILSELQTKLLSADRFFSLLKDELESGRPPSVGMNVLAGLFMALAVGGAVDPSEVKKYLT